MSAGRLWIWLLQLPARLLALAAILAIRLYQWTISPWLGPRCRFFPTCSEYTILAIRKYGPVRGTARGVRRILRCHPWHPGGYDPP